MLSRNCRQCALIDMGNATCSSTELLDFLESYAAGLRPTYVELLSNAMLAALLIPFLLSLFYFSHAARRHTPMFLLVVLSVLFAVAQYSYSVFVGLEALFHPAANLDLLVRPALTIMLVARDLPNFVADLALFCRLLVVYPRPATSYLTLTAVLAPAVLIKLMRVTSMVLIGVYDYQDQQGAGLFVYWSQSERSWLIVNRALSALDNAYATMFFMCKLRSSFNSQSASGRVTMNSGGSLGSRIRTLFWIAMSNFIIPVPLYIVQLVLALIQRDSTTIGIFQLYIVFSSVICVAFATIWASTTSTRHHSPESTEETTTVLQFRMKPKDLVENERKLACEPAGPEFEKQEEYVVYGEAQ